MSQFYHPLGHCTCIEHRNSSLGVHTALRAQMSVATGQLSADMFVNMSTPTEVVDYHCFQMPDGVGQRLLMQHRQSLGSAVSK